MVGLAHVLPLDRETRWADLLAVLIEADATCLSDVLRLTDDASGATVSRETTGTSGRTDLLVYQGEALRCVIEVKVLSGLSTDQLDRYMLDHPNAQRHLLVHAAHLLVSGAREAGWHSTTWEVILHLFARSANAWVAETARAWIAHLQNVIGAVDASSTWNGLAPGESRRLAQWTRLSWVLDRLELPPVLNADLVFSSAGARPIARLTAAASRPGYRVHVEVEEGLSVRTSKVSTSKLLGPRIFVGLLLGGVTSSAHYDWDYLFSMWPILQDAPVTWLPNSASPKGHDRKHWERLQGLGMPKYVGVGFGQGQVNRTGECMFGVRAQLDSDTTNLQLVERLTELIPTLISLARA